MGVLGQFQNGPIQFDHNTGAIEPRGQVDQPSATASPVATATPAPDPVGDVPLGGSPADTDTTFGDTGAAAGVLGNKFGQDDTEQDASPSDRFKRASIDSEPFGSINSEPFGNLIGNQPFGNTIRWNTAFDDGGEVDAGGDGEPQSNPMSIIKSALSFGRKKMGLPLNFSDGTSEQQEDAAAPSFDDGGVIPEPGQQDEGAGSEGTMPADPHKAIAYLAGDGAVAPEIAHALEQHVDPQGQMDQSSRTMASLTAAPDPESKFGMLQHYRTEFNGYSAGARAALDQGNVGLAAKHATEAFDRVPTGKKISFAPASGGSIAVIVKNAVNGMRQFGGAGLLGKAPIKAGDDAWHKFHGDGGGVLSMDDGGEVEDDIADAAPPQEPTGEAAPEGAPAEEDTQPVVLNPEQFKKLLGAGYDKPLDDGWSGLLSTIMGALGPNSAEAAPLDRSAQGGGVTTVGKSDRLPGLPQNPVGATTPQDRAQGSFAPPPAPAPKTNLDESNDRFANHQKRVEALADKLFPWAGQAAQRSAYVAHAMEKITESEGRVDQQHAKSTGDVGMAREVFKQGQITARSDATRQSKWDTEMAKLDAKAQQGRLSELGKVIRTEMLNHPNATAQDMAAKFGAPVAVVNQLVSSGARGGSGGQAGPGPAGPAASSSGPREGDTRPYTVGGVTKQYKFENGQWRRQN